MKRATLSFMLLAAFVLAACVSVPAAPVQPGAGQPALDQTVSQPLAAPAESAAPDVFQQEQVLIDLYARANPGVVNITVVAGAAGQGAARQVAQGSGFVFDMQGHIVTNNHVVAGATNIRVTFADGVEVPAQLVGADPNSDLAVIKVDPAAATLVPLPLGQSDALQVGQTVIAIGNPFGLEGSMTTGIVSGLGRLLPDGGVTPDGQRYSIPDVVQTDAAINPGNSGGPLLNLKGEVIGVNTAITSTGGTSSGVGYAVPVDIVSKVVPALIAKGKVEYPYLGISGGTLGSAAARAMNLPADQHGVLVAQVVPGGPADKAGLRGSDRQVEVDGLPVVVGGDVIVAVDGQPVREFNDLLTYLVRHTEVGQQVTLTLLRGGAQQEVKVTLAARP